jgi:hypothetical protein
VSNIHITSDGGDSEFMTAAEFAALPADTHHAVWKAAGEGRVATMPASGEGGTGTIRRYHRAQVLGLLGRAAANRDGQS